MASAIARKYQELREARGLATGEVGRHLGVDEQVVKGWENDASVPTHEHIAGLASLYGVSQDELRHIQDATHHPGGN